MPKYILKPKTPKPQPPRLTEEQKMAAQLADAVKAPKWTVVERLKYQRQLFELGTESVLYEAPSHAWYMLGCLTNGVFCILYAGYNSYANVLDLPASISWWVGYAYAIVVIMMGAMGAYFFMGATRVVSRIAAIPATKQLWYDPRAKSGATEAARKSKLVVEFRIRRVLWFLPDKRIYVAPNEVMLHKRMSAPVVKMKGGVLVEAERMMRAQRKAWAEYDKNHLMTTPFRMMWRALREMWKGARRAMTQEGFAKIEIAGKRHKIDVTGGWAKGGGKSLDRLVAINEQA